MAPHAPQRSSRPGEAGALPRRRPRRALDATEPVTEGVEDGACDAGAARQLERGAHDRVGGREVAARDARGTWPAPPTVADRRRRGGRPSPTARTPPPSGRARFSHQARRRRTSVARARPSRPRVERRPVADERALDVDRLPEASEPGPLRGRSAPARSPSAWANQPSSADQRQHVVAVVGEDAGQRRGPTRVGGSRSRARGSARPARRSRGRARARRARASPAGSRRSTPSTPVARDAAGRGAAAPPASDGGRARSASRAAARRSRRR